MEAELLEALKDLWVKSTNLFKDLPAEEIEKDECLQGLSLSIDNAKNLISKYSDHEFSNCLPQCDFSGFSVCR